MKKAFFIIFLNCYFCVHSQTHKTAYEYKIKGEEAINNKEWNKAIIFFQHSLEEEKKLKNIRTTNIIYLCNETANLYYYLGDYENSILYYKEAVLNIKKSVGKYSSDYTAVIYDLANAYHSLGEYNYAINLIKESIDIENNKLKVSGSIKIRKLFSLLELYLELGQYENFAQTINQIREIFESSDFTRSEFKKHYHEFLYFVAKFYTIIGDSNEALANFLTVLEYVGDTYGKSSIRYGAVLNDIALVYSDLNNHEKAILLLKESLEITKKNLGILHQEYAISLNNLAELYISINEYENAISIYLEALKILEKVDTTRHLHDLLINVADAYEKSEINHKANEYYIKAFEYLYKSIDSVFSFMTENERYLYIKELDSYFDYVESFNYNTNNLYTGSAECNLNNIYLLKGLLLSGYTNMLKDLSQYNDDAVTNLIADYRNSYALLSKELTTPIKDRVYNVDSLQNYVQQKEAVLVKKHSELFGSNELVKDWKSIQNHLKSDELIIEFSKFQYRTKEGWTEDQLYMAYVFDSKSSSPTPIYLFNEDELKQVLNNTTPSNLYKTRGSKAKSGRANTSEALYNLVWKPIEGHFSNKKTIYFSPSGTLNQLALTILQNKDKQTMLSRYDMHQMTNTASLLKKKKKTEKEPAAFIGGIQYDFNPDKASLQQKETVALNLFDSTNSNNHNGTWPYLSGTKVEVNKLNLMYKEKNLNTTIVSGEYATEEWFKSLSGNSPKVLHVATHGFFFEDNNDSLRHSNRQLKYTFAKDPLLRSGLILAHGNYTWKNGTNPFNEEDGVATAFEISKLDFQNTDLVVLSACETGLGDIDGSEGVYGLQRAFKMAGVDLIMMSLWEVPDKETAEFMELFYSNWLSGQNIREAFRNTQLEMSNTYNDSPEKWAAFVLVE